MQALCLTRLVTRPGGQECLFISVSEKEIKVSATRITSCSYLQREKLSSEQVKVCYEGVLREFPFLRYFPVLMLRWYMFQVASPKS